MAKSANYFLGLRSIRVRHLFKTKGSSNLDYLEWSKAWHLIKSRFPDANYIVHRDKDTNYNYFTNHNSGWVVVTVEANEIPHTSDLAITDNRNNPIPKESITSVDAQNTIQRALTKAIALHGVGLNAWTGEKDYITETEFQAILSGDDIEAAREIRDNCQLTSKQRKSLFNKFKKPQNEQ